MSKRRKLHNKSRRDREALFERNRQTTQKHTPSIAQARSRGTMIESPQLAYGQLMHSYIELQHRFDAMHEGYIVGIKSPHEQAVSRAEQWVAALVASDPSSEGWLERVFDARHFLLFVKGHNEASWARFRYGQGEHKALRGLAKPLHWDVTQLELRIAAQAGIGRPDAIQDTIILDSTTS